LTYTDKDWETYNNPKILQQYYQSSKDMKLIYKIDDSQKSWREVEESIELFKNFDIDFDVYITYDKKENHYFISKESLLRGYNYVR
jgi:hypothetical protein